MRLICRPLAPEETDHERLWFGVSTGAFALAAVWLALNLPWPTCAFHQITGHPCPTCGATRAAIALFHGNIFAAWHWNPLALAFYGLLAVCNVYALTAISAGAPRLRIVQVAPAEKRFWLGLAAALALVNWGYLLMTNVSG